MPTRTRQSISSKKCLKRLLHQRYQLSKREFIAPGCSALLPQGALPCFAPGMDRSLALLQSMLHGIGQ